jgi:hypothetical protein
MKRGRLWAMSTALLGSAALTPVPAFAAAPITCSALAGLLSANAYVSQTSSDNQGHASPTATIVAATSKNAAYCQIRFQFSAQSGPTYGYAPGQSQTIGLGFGLPLNSVDGGVSQSVTSPVQTWTAVNGAWNGKIQNLGGGGLIGTVGATTGATNFGWVGSSTDGGHNTSSTGSGSLGNFGVIQATHQLDTGEINDYIGESVHQQYVWAKWLANKYYGINATRNYWNGCSTGGRQGLQLAEKWGYDFDGILAGAPATFHDEFRLEDSWPASVNRDFVVGAGHSSITTGQLIAATSAAIAACDVMGTDTVADGVIDDPRACSWSAANNICGALNAPASPNCLDSVQASAIDLMWDGPRNHDGQRNWYGVDRGVSGGTLSTALQSSTGQVMAWDHKDLTYSVNNIYATRALADANPLGEPNPIAYEDEYKLGDALGGPEDLARNFDLKGIISNFYSNCKNGVGGCKIITWQGAADQLIRWRDSVFFYRAAATTFGNGTTAFGTPQSTPGGSGLQSWWRYYHAPGEQHCGGGPGANPTTIVPDGNSQLFDDLVKWVETDTPPQSAGDPTKLGILATGSVSFGTRPICPWPTTAVYSGSGSTTVASNYNCQGNIDANVTGVGSGAPGIVTVDSGVPVVCKMLHTVYGQETSNSLDTAEQGINPAPCPAQP